MSSFTKDLIIKKLPKSDLFEVYIAFDYHVGHEDSEEIISVFKGFKTDLASIPWFVRWLISKVGKHAQGAVVHDLLYNKRGVMPLKTYTRKECDLIFLEAMIVLEVSKWKRMIIYQAVRRFGWIAWRKKRK